VDHYGQTYKWKGLGLPAWLDNCFTNWSKRVLMSAVVHLEQQTQIQIRKTPSTHKTNLVKHFEILYEVYSIRLPTTEFGKPTTNPTKFRQYWPVAMKESSPGAMAESSPVAMAESWPLWPLWLGKHPVPMETVYLDLVGSWQDMYTLLPSPPRDEWQLWHVTPCNDFHFCSIRCFQTLQMTRWQLKVDSKRPFL